MYAISLPTLQYRHPEYAGEQQWRGMLRQLRYYTDPVIRNVEYYGTPIRGALEVGLPALALAKAVRDDWSVSAHHPSSAIVPIETTEEWQREMAARLQEELRAKQMRSERGSARTQGKKTRSSDPSPQSKSKKDEDVSFQATDVTGQYYTPQELEALKQQTLREAGIKQKQKIDEKRRAQNIIKFAGNDKWIHYLHGVPPKFMPLQTALEDTTAEAVKRISQGQAVQHVINTTQWPIDEDDPNLPRSLMSAQFRVKDYLTDPKAPDFINNTSYMPRAIIDLSKSANEMVRQKQQKEKEKLARLSEKI